MPVNNSKILFVDTSNDKQLDVFLISGNKLVAQKHLKGDYKVSEYLLKMIAQVLQKGKIELSSLDGIVTVIGPGAFTSLRIAVAVANTLAYSLQIPVAGFVKNKGDNTKDKMIKIARQNINKAKVSSFIKPYYDREPNITKAKS